MLKRADALRVAVLCSRRAPGLRTLLSAGDRAHYRVVGVITSDPASNALPDTAGAGVPCVVHDISAFYRALSGRLTDLAARPAFDSDTASMLAVWKPDLVVLCGYLHVLTGPMLSAFPRQIINIHDSDLCLTGDDDRPRYRGLRSTRDAITAGEPETRSTIHIVTEDVDVGPPLVRSWAFPVHMEMVDAARAAQATDVLKAYAYAQREWMMRSAWGGMLDAAVNLYASGDVRVLGNCAYVKGAPGPLTLPEPSAFAAAGSAP